MKILRYAALAGLLLSLPSFVLSYFSSGLGSALSYLTFIILIAYFIRRTPKGRPLFAFILLGLSYYLIAGFNYTGLSDIDFAQLVIKFLIVIICGAEVVRDTSVKEIYLVLLVGALSIVVHAIFFPLYNAEFTPTYGRFSGFYLNPNFAGAICLMGFALSFGMKNPKLKYLGQVIFAVGGFFTFSRYFLGMWIFFNLLSVFISRKNLWVPALGVIGLLIIFAFGSSLKLNTVRFNAIQSIFTGEHANTAALEEDSRTETWALYKDIILDKPLLGNGFKQLQGKNSDIGVGVHNTYLLVIGEAGIFPFLILIGIYLFLLIKSFQFFKPEPYLFMSALVLFTALLVSHNYFEKYSLPFLSMYLYIVLTERSKDTLDHENEII
jgi:O-antigen ligase